MTPNPKNNLILGLIPAVGFGLHSVGKAEAEMAAHQAIRPDHLAAMRAGIADPKAPAYLAWVSWVKRKEELDAQLALARGAKTGTWRTVMAAEESQPAQPANLRNVSHEDRVAHGRMGGRPRQENPSKEALRLRARREAKKRSAA